LFGGEVVNYYSETCEIRTPLERAKSVPNSEVSSFQSAICTENSNLGPDEVSLFHSMSSLCGVVIRRFHCMQYFLFVDRALLFITDNLIVNLFISHNLVSELSFSLLIYYSISHLTLLSSVFILFQVLEVVGKRE
jgi:hypothetical protein